MYVNETIIGICVVVLGICALGAIHFYINKPSNEKTTNLPEKNVVSNRRHVKDVKAGERIQIEWSRIQGGISYLKCLNNDPETKKILLQIQWGNYKEVGGLQYEKIILDYDCYQLKNFHLLNPIENISEKSEDNFDIATLQKKMNEALEKEEYEIANELQKKIDDLLKKNQNE